MAKIIISEKDLTRPDNIEENNNVVYIPGYSLMGPENTPTLCKTVKEFESIFGKEPYKFTQNQEIETVRIASAGEYEKSYIFAHEILNVGLPIIFNRIIPDSSAATKAKAVSEQLYINPITITAKEFGAYGNSIKCTFEPITQSGTEDTPVVLGYKFREYLDDGIQKAETASVKIISFDPNSENYFNNSLYQYVDFSVGTASGSKASAQTVEISLSLGIDSFSLSYFYTYINTTDTYEFILDKNSCEVKYLTAGSYPSIIYSKNNFVDKCAKKLISIAEQRGDCTALIDFDNVKIDSSWISKLNSSEYFDSNTSSKYASAFMPWGLYNIVSLKDSTTGLNLKSILPGSFAYLNCLANSIKTNADWYAIAGVNRGYISNLIQLENPMTGAIAETLQTSEGVSVNAILDIKPYGYCIWGNRTLNKNQNGLIASSFLNIRTLTNDIKKLVYKVAKKLTFEQNSNILWLNFKAAIEPTLDKIVSDNGLTDYKIIKLTTTKRATIACKIRLVAIEAVEDWDITIELADSYTTVE